MNGYVKAAIIGAAAYYAGNKLGPHVAKALRPNDGIPGSVSEFKAAIVITDAAPFVTAAAVAAALFKVL